MPPDSKELWAQLDELGYAEVCARRAAGKYAGTKRDLVDEWIKRVDQSAASELERRRSASSLESNQTARSAKNAAWTAAIATIASAIVAIVAVVIKSS